MVEWFFLVRINQQKVTGLMISIRVQIKKYNAEHLGYLLCFDEKNEKIPPEWDSIFYN